MAKKTDHLELVIPQMDDEVQDTIEDIGKNYETIDEKVNDNKEGLSELKDNVKDHKDDEDNPHDVTSKQVTVIDSIDGDKDGDSDDYPTGISCFEVSKSDDYEDYPEDYGTVFTIKIDSSRISQMFFRHYFNDSQKGVYYRHYNKENGWSDWYEIETKDHAEDKLKDHKDDTDNPHDVSASDVDTYDKDEIKVKIEDAKDDANDYTDDEIDDLKEKLDDHKDDHDNPHKVSASDVDTYDKDEIEEEISKAKNDMKDRISDEVEKLEDRIKELEEQVDEMEDDIKDNSSDIKDNESDIDD